MLECSIIPRPQQAQIRVGLGLDAAAQDQRARFRRFPPGSCGTRGHRGPAGTASQEGRNKQAAHDGNRHRAPERGARQRYHCKDGGERRQHHRAGAPDRSLDDASRRVRPCETSVSIWSTRITALRMIIPASAINPSSATKPNGWLATFSPSEAPIMPQRRCEKHQDQPREVLQRIINSVSMTITINGNRTKIDALPLADSSIAPPISIR